MNIDLYLDWASGFVKSVLVSLFNILKGAVLGIRDILLSLYHGIVGAYNVPAYLRSLQSYSERFSGVEKVLAILTFVLTYAILVTATVLLILAIRDLVYFLKGKKIPRRQKPHKHKHKHNKNRKNHKKSKR